MAQSSGYQCRSRASGPFDGRTRRCRRAVAAGALLHHRGRTTAGPCGGRALVSSGSRARSRQCAGHARKVACLWLWRALGSNRSCAMVSASGRTRKRCWANIGSDAVTTLVAESSRTMPKPHVGIVWQPSKVRPMRSFSSDNSLCWEGSAPGRCGASALVPSSRQPRPRGWASCPRIHVF